IKSLAKKSQKQELFQSLMINFIKDNAVFGKNDNNKYKFCNLLNLLFRLDSGPETYSSLKNILEVFQEIVFKDPELVSMVVEKIKILPQDEFKLFLQVFLCSVQNFIFENRDNLNSDELDMVKGSIKDSIDSLIVYKTL